MCVCVCVCCIARERAAVISPVGNGVSIRVMHGGIARVSEVGIQDRFGGSAQIYARQKKPLSMGRYCQGRRDVIGAGCVAVLAAEQLAGSLLGGALDVLPPAWVFKVVGDEKLEVFRGACDRRESVWISAWVVVGIYKGEVNISVPPFASPSLASEQPVGVDVGEQCASGLTPTNVGVANPLELVALGWGQAVVAEQHLHLLERDTEGSIAASVLTCQNK